MGDVDKGDPKLLLQFLKFKLHGAAKLEIQCPERFIEKKNLRIIDQGSCNCYSLPLSSGELGWFALFITRKLHQFQHL